MDDLERTAVSEFVWGCLDPRTGCQEGSPTTRVVRSQRKLFKKHFNALRLELITPRFGSAYGLYVRGRVPRPSARERAGLL